MRGSVPAPSSSLIDRVHGQFGGSPRAIESGLTGQECLLRALSRVPDPRDARGVRHRMPAGMAMSIGSWVAGSQANAAKRRSSASVHGAIGGAYRSQGITTLELRFNPMKRNRGGERDLDHIILAATRGLDVASLEYPQVRAGLILMMDRTFTPRQNEIIVEKAIRWAPRGIVGIDIAGPRPDHARYDYSAVKPMVEEARAAGLGVTIHVGEEGGEFGRDEIGEVLEVLRPDRIGHGILAAGDEELMRLLRDAEVVLEICPASNLLTKALPHEEAVCDVFRTFVERGVRFTIATDGPEMMRTHLRDELDLLLRIGALTQDELDEANQRGHDASFVRGGYRTANV